jgi:electron transport complex protein RnfA
MSDFISLILAAALVNNLVFVQLLGVSYFFSASNRLSAAIELSLFTGAVFLVSSFLAHLIFKFLLHPLGLDIFKLIVFLVLSGALSTLLAVIVRDNFPRSYRSNQLLFHFAGGNSAVIGLMLTNNFSNMSLLQTMTYSLGTAIGFGLVVVGFSAMGLRLSTADVPASFRGSPLLLLSAGIAAMGFLGFSGLV